MIIIIIGHVYKRGTFWWEEPEGGKKGIRDGPRDMSTFKIHFLCIYVHVHICICMRIETHKNVVKVMEEIDYEESIIERVNLTKVL
jgi:hypothetical protein